MHAVYAYYAHVYAYVHVYTHKCAQVHAHAHMYMSHPHILMYTRMHKHVPTREYSMYAPVIGPATTV